MKIEMEDIETRDPVATAAVDWFLRIEREEPTLETLAEWQKWLEAAPAHRTAYETIQRTWSLLDSVPPRTGNPAAPRRRWVWPALGSLGVAAALALVVIRMLPTGSYDTGIGEHRELTLPDDSRVLIGARSKLKVHFTAQSREVQLLSGEAFFTVAQDPARPFTVSAGLNTITALGTAFNVRRYGESVALEVADGRVRLDAPDSSAILRQGEETAVGARGEVPAVRTLPLENIATWRSGRHSYIDEPLSLVIADLNRYATRRVTIDDPELGNLRITTTFFSNDWQGWLLTLASAAPNLAVEEDGEGVRIVPGN